MDSCQHGQRHRNGSETRGIRTGCSQLASGGILPLFRKNPEKSRLNSITSTPTRFATPALRNTVPMNRKMAAADRLNSTRKRINFKKLGHAGIKPVIG